MDESQNGSPEVPYAERLVTLICPLGALPSLSLAVVDFGTRLAKGEMQDEFDDRMRPMILDDLAFWRDTLRSMQTLMETPEEAELFAALTSKSMAMKAAGDTRPISTISRECVNDRLEKKEG